MLTGEAKRKYQHRYMAGYMRDYRARRKDLSVKTSVKTQGVDVKTPEPVKVLNIPGPIIRPDVRPYDPTRRYEPGEEVLINRGKRLQKVRIPSLDADGNEIPKYW